ncbi:MAG: ArnT family glycosyltransferase [Anaerolineae bacterium]
MTSMIRTRPRKDEILTIAALCLLTALVRLGALLLPQRIVWGDEPFYLWLGRNWLSGRGYTFTGYSDVHHTPMYPLLSGLAYLLTRNFMVSSAQAMELASDICYVLFGVLLVIPVYLLAKEMYRREVGYISLALLAIYPAVATAPLFWGTLTEPPYYFFVYTGLLMTILAMRRERLWSFLLAGLCFGLAYLTRPEAVAYTAIGGLVLALVRFFERSLFTRRTLVALTLYVLGFLLLFLPYAYYVARETGSWMISEKAGVTFVTCIGLSEGDTRAFDQATWGLDSTGREVFFFSRESYHVSMLDVIRMYPSEFIQLFIRNVRRFISSLFSLRLFPYYFLPLIGLAFFKKPWDKARTKGELLLLASLTPVGVFLLFFIQDRYIATLLPTLVIWLGLGSYELGLWLSQTVANLLAGHALRRRWLTFMMAIPTLVLFLCFLLLQPKIITGYTTTGSFRSEHRAVGLWLKEHIPQDSIVMSRYPAISFYADARWEPTPNARYEQVLAYARANHVNYFVLDELETRELRPQLAFLLNEYATPAELELVHVLHSPDGKLMVFRLE